jgi:hypothetical protein
MLGGVKLSILDRNSTEISLVMLQFSPRPKSNGEVKNFTMHVACQTCRSVIVTFMYIYVLRSIYTLESHARESRKLRVQRNDSCAGL